MPPRIACKLDFPLQRGNSTLGTPVISNPACVTRTVIPSLEAADPTRTGYAGGAPVRPSVYTDDVPK
jgi:hypothetical protein